MRGPRSRANPGNLADPTGLTRLPVDACTDATHYSHGVTDLLSNLVVVDLTRALAGPHAAMMLGDLGARVIKVESPDR